MTTAELVHEILVTKATAFEKGRLFDRMHPLVGDGLSTAPRETHRVHRRIVQPAFHQDRMSGYGGLISDHAHGIGASWQPGSVDDLWPELVEYSANNLAATLFGRRLTDEAVAIARREVPLILNIVVPRSFMPAMLDRLPLPINREFYGACARLRAAVKDAIATSRDNPQRNDFLSLLEEASSGAADQRVADEALVDHVVTMLMGGVDTVASTIAWSLYELSRAPEIDQRLATELQGGLPCAYLNQFLNEITRLYSVVLLMRRATEPVVLGDVEIPAGTEVAFSLHALHRDPRYFPDPEKFDPDRWQAKTSANIPRTGFIPFGAGNRKCIGDTFAWTEVSSSLSSIVPRWRFSPHPERRITQQKLGIIPLPAAMPLTLTPRR
ncbi:cytochrome P450 [Streptomyces sp. NPDC048419]|uniref:cytochrome P450 n=1 Tax=Streptomyces sp. NPDC048419 TaxID=3365547 RepID=UPI0037162D9B